MGCVMLQILCIAKNCPCKLRWCLSVENLELYDSRIARQKNKQESNDTGRKIVTCNGRTLACVGFLITYIRNLCQLLVLLK